MFQCMLDLQKEILAQLKILSSKEDPLLSQMPSVEEEEMTRLQVIKYLGICPRTYIRKVKDGTLKPRKMPGGDRFYKSDLIEAHKESIRRGRI